MLVTLEIVLRKETGLGSLQESPLFQMLRGPAMISSAALVGGLQASSKAAHD